MRNTTHIPTVVLQEMFNELYNSQTAPQAQRSLLSILDGRRKQIRAEQTLLQVLRENHVDIPQYISKERQ